MPTDTKDIKIPTMPTPFAKPQRTYPISERENLLLALDHKKPLWMPNLRANSQFSPHYADGDMPPTDKEDSEDWFGVKYIYSETQGSSTPEAGVLKDITEWREKVIWPDMDKWDWKKGSEDFHRDEALACGYQYRCGCFERLHAFEGFEQALIDLITEPEECRAFFDRLADYKIEIFERMHEVYHYDYIIYNDDWGTQRGPFFSTELVAQTLLEPTAKIAQAVKARGVRFIFHNCGLIDAFIPCIVETVGADALQIQPINDIKGILSRYGEKITPDFRADPYLMFDPATSPEQAARAAREIVDTYGAQSNPGSGIIINAFALNEEVYYAYENELYTYSLEKYKGL